MQLQHQLSNGSWVDVGSDRTAEFLDMCVKYNTAITNHTDAITAMENGNKLRNDHNDWYSKCRMFNQQAHDEQMKSARKLEYERNQLHCKSCGQTGHPGSGFCDDCC